MRRLAPMPLLLLLGIALPAAISGCATASSGEAERAGPELSREQALALCMESTPRDLVLYPDAVAACMEGYGWVYTGPGRY